MASVVEICNRALQKVGAKAIVSLTDSSPAARAVNRAYEPVRDALYEDHHWRFTIERVELAASATAPVFGKTNFFPLPSDFVKLAPPDDDWNPNDRDWRIEGQNIVTNDSAPLEVLYCKRVTDPNVMTPLFREALATGIAYEICEELTQSNTKKASLAEDTENILTKAKKSNTIQMPPIDAPEDTWISARR